MKLKIDMGFDEYNLEEQCLQIQKDYFVNITVTISKRRDDEEFYIILKNCVIELPLLPM